MHHHRKTCYKSKHRHLGTNLRVMTDVLVETQTSKDPIEGKFGTKTIGENTDHQGMKNQGGIIDPRSTTIITADQEGDIGHLHRHLDHTTIGIIMRMQLQ